jgi:hypothetical protein
MEEIMLVDSMIADLWSEASCKEEVTNNPDVEAFKAALESLDGIKRTLLSLQCKNGRELVIGGGDNGYVVYVAFSEMEFWNLLSTADQVELVYVTAGGQRGDYAARYVVDKERAFEAGVSFIQDGGLAKSLNLLRIDGHL